MRRGLLGSVVLAPLVIGAALWQSAGVRNRSAERAVARNASGPLTVVATGDVLFTGALPPPRTNPAADTSMTDLIGGATVALTNLEVTLLEESPARQASARPPRGPVGSAHDVKTLVNFGFNVMARANNHAADYGAEGIRDTDRILNAAGLMSVGCADDLDRARMPTFVGVGSRRVAVLSATASAVPEARATHPRADIKGRPGVSPLRYTADITADPATYETLRRSALPTPARATSSAHQLSVFGTTIKKGDKTVVDFRADAQDVKEIVDQIKMARTEADVVVLAVHSHEPSNRSPLPAEFLRAFAHAAIDAGAGLVVGHGPHQLRGIEIYHQGAILYSLGNFLFEYDAVTRQAADVFDAGVDLYHLALGAVAEDESRTPPSFNEDVWWESVISVATFENGRLRYLRLHPIDLGVTLPREQRGVPQLAGLSRGTMILERLDHLSRIFGTRIQLEGGIGVIDLTAQDR